MIFLRNCTFHKTLLYFITISNQCSRPLLHLLQNAKCMYVSELYGYVVFWAVTLVPLYALIVASLPAIFPLVLTSFANNQVLCSVAVFSFSVCLCGSGFPILFSLFYSTKEEGFISHYSFDFPSLQCFSPIFHPLFDFAFSVCLCPYFSSYASIPPHSVHF